MFWERFSVGILTIKWDPEPQTIDYGSTTILVGKLLLQNEWHSFGRSQETEDGSFSIIQ